MYKINILFLAIIFLLLIFGTIDMFGIKAIDFEDKYVALAETFGIMMMLANGTFFGSRLFRIAIFCFAVTFLGALFKILHLNGADEIILLSDLALFIVYFIHFIKKKPKIRLDYLKVLTLSTMLLVSPLVLLHLIDHEQQDTLLATSHIVFWITFVDFIFSYRQLLLRN